MIRIKNKSCVMAIILVLLINLCTNKHFLSNIGFHYLNINFKGSESLDVEVKINIIKYYC